LCSSVNPVNIQLSIIDNKQCCNDSILHKSIASYVSRALDCSIKGTLKYVHPFTKSNSTNIFATMVSVAAGVSKTYEILDSSAKLNGQAINVGLPVEAVRKMCAASEKNLAGSLFMTLPAISPFLQLVTDCINGYRLVNQNMIAIQAHFRHLKRKFPNMNTLQLENAVRAGRPSLLYDSIVLSKERLPLAFLFSFLYFTYPHEESYPIRISILDRVVNDKEIREFNGLLKSLSEDELSLYLNSVLFAVNNQDAQTALVSRRCLARMLITEDIPNQLENLIKGINIDVDALIATRLKLRQNIVSVSTDLTLRTIEAVRHAKTKKKKVFSDVYLAEQFASFCEENQIEPSKSKFEFYKKIRSTYE